MAPPRVLLPHLLALAVGCAAPAACDRFDRFEGHAPGFFEALHAIPSEVADVGPEPGLRLPALEAHLPHSTLQAVRYTDLDSDLQGAAVHFAGPQAAAASG